MSRQSANIEKIAGHNSLIQTGEMHYVQRKDCFTNKEKVWFFSRKRQRGMTEC